MDKRLGSCCVYVVTSQSSRGLHDVSKVFSVTSETGIVYVSEPERLVELEHDNITVGLFIVVNGSRHDDDGDGDPESESVPSHWLSVANISVHVKRVETDYNVTSSAERKRYQLLILFGLLVWNITSTLHISKTML